MSSSVRERIQRRAVVTKLNSWKADRISTQNIMIKLSRNTFTVTVHERKRYMGRPRDSRTKAGWVFQACPGKSEEEDFVNVAGGRAGMAGPTDVLYCTEVDRCWSCLYPEHGQPTSDSARNDMYFDCWYASLVGLNKHSIENRDVLRNHCLLHSHSFCK